MGGYREQAVKEWCLSKVNERRGVDDLSKARSGCVYVVCAVIEIR